MFSLIYIHQNNGYWKKHFFNEDGFEVAYYPIYNDLCVRNSFFYVIMYYYIKAMKLHRKQGENKYNNPKYCY